MLKTVVRAFSEARLLDERHFPVARAAAAARVHLYPSLVRGLRDLDHLDGFLAGARERDTFFFVTHKHYLAKPLGLRDRIGCAVHHYQHEARIFDERYRQLVYHGSGIALWSQEVLGHGFTITLVATNDNRYEGDLNILLTVDGLQAWRMSYSVVDGVYFGLPSGPVIFVTRNQAIRGRELDIFMTVFRQHSPPYFCLAATAGAAQAQRISHLAAVRSESQIAFEPERAAGFSNSYSNFWSRLGARDAGALGYVLDVPLRHKPLSEVSADHRRRALRRRERWAEVTADSKRTLAGHRLEQLVQGPAALVKLRSDAVLLPAADEPGNAVATPSASATSVRRTPVPPPGPGQAAPEAQGETLLAKRKSESPPGRSPCTAVVVTYQSAGHVGALLEALQTEREAGLDLDVVVVDHASTDGTVDVVAGFGWARLVPTGGNFGYAAGVNVGERLAPPGQALLVLNPDLVPAPGALGRLLDALDDLQVGVVVPRIEDDDGTLSPSLRHEPSLGRAVADAVLGRRSARLPRGWSGMVWDPQDYDSEQSPDWATGAALLVSGACRAAVGEWDERFFLYSEETDYLRRVREEGLRIRYLPDAVVRHAGSGSGTSDALHALCVVNSVRYYRRYHGRPASATFGAVTALCELLRARRPASRLALRALLSRRARSALPGPGASIPAHDPGEPCG